MLARTNNELVKGLIAAGSLSSPKLAAAFRVIDRVDFVPREQRELAYRDHPLPLGHGQTISQPSTVAFMLELLDVGVGMKALEVGAGSGYVAALLARLVSERGMVVAIERLPELAEQARANLAHYHLPQIVLLEADGSCGYPDSSPYDRIIVSAAAHKLPTEFAAQLAPLGRLVAPVGDYPQDIVLLERTTEGFAERRFPGFVFVPLVGKSKSEQ